MDPHANQKIQYLLTKVESLSLQQEKLQKNIAEIANEIRLLQFETMEKPIDRLSQTASPETVIEPTLAQDVILAQPRQRPPVFSQEKPDPSPRPAENPKPTIFQTSFDNSLEKKSRSAIDFEKFIGENIISKIGIVILVTGVGIGTKYAIDKELLSPIARIILGYLLGAGVLFSAIRLKEKYENFSAILVSGAMAIFYLITFAAYDFYGLISQGLAFGLMVVFTLFTVSASLLYNRQWIALFGMVGAYGVPFLLSDGSGRVMVLFGYISLLNLGIFAVAYKKYWRILYYSAFILSWIIFLSWFFTKFEADMHFGLCLAFSTIFFFTFYGVFVMHKLVEKRKFEPEDVFFLLLNSFIYFGIGYAAFSEYALAERFAGLFTLGNAFIHFVVALAIYRMKLADRNLFYLVSGLVLVFITLAIPVQLDGEWVTLIWAAEAALLYWIGRSKQVGFYEKLSYPLMMLALLSQVQDWGGLSTPTTNIVAFEFEGLKPIFNIGFLIGILVCLAFGFMVLTGKKHGTVILNPVLKKPPPFVHFFGNMLPPAALILLLYFTFRQEWINLWIERYSSRYNTTANDSFSFYPEGASVLVLLRVWLLNYTSVFLAIWGIVLLKLITDKSSRTIYLVLSAIALLLAASVGNFWLGELRDSTINPGQNIFSITRATAISIRYISFASTGFLLAVLFQYKKRVAPLPKYAEMVFDLLLHLNLLFAVSGEMITWLKINHFAQFDKLGLSIFWGVYSLLLIGFGIFRKKQHLRIGAIVLFGITLIKLFFYDIANLSSMAKTIVFISLGILLLIISFLYNKYKIAIGGPDEK
jgi:uncharacterized membrane protein